MNKNRLKREGEKWVEEGIITNEQLNAILKKYERKDYSYLLIILAALLMSISIIIFIFSEWAQIQNIFRITVMLFIMSLFYIVGFYLFGNKKQLDERKRITGTSLIILGYVMFGATLFLTLYMYDVHTFSAWPFIMWSLVGLALYFVVPNQYLFTIALLITIYGQIHSSISFASFNYIIFILFIIGYFHYVYHHGNILTHYVFNIGLAIQLFIFTVTEFDQFYWFLFFTLAMYILALLLPKKLLQRRMQRISIVSILLFKMYEIAIVQSDYFVNELQLLPSFFILQIIGLVIAFLLLVRSKRSELITLILFVPLFFLPYNYIYIVIFMFIYSLYWLIYGFQKRNNDKVFLGLVSFIISIFAVIVQYAWETLNKSLFFLIAGFVLFIISILFERRRRKENIGGVEK